MIGEGDCILTDCLRYIDVAVAPVVIYGWYRHSWLLFTRFMGGDSINHTTFSWIEIPCLCILRLVHGKLVSTVRVQVVNMIIDLGLTVTLRELESLHWSCGCHQ